MQELALRSPEEALPPQSMNEVDAVGQVSAATLAREVSSFHQKGLRRRRYRDLTAEKYILHIDAEGDGQYADIYNGQRVVIPVDLTGGPRTQNNLLRPLVDNMVAYHTTMPFRFSVLTGITRAEKSGALVDQVLANHLALTLRWNQVFAEAMYLASAYGHCPVHAYWRDEAGSEQYDSADIPWQGPLPGMIDSWCGDPWDSVYHAASKANSVPMWTYGRTLPANLVRDAFAHVPEAAKLEGNDRMPSASRFQRIARKWLQGSLQIHGSNVVYAGEGGDELIAVVCREIAPGFDSDYPGGRLDVVALPGAASTDEGEASGRATSSVLLHSGELPGQTFSAESVFAHHRFDDRLGKPFVGDLDDLQLQLNQLETLQNEFIRRSTHAPYVLPDGTDLDTAIWDDDVLMEIPPEARQKPYYMELPAQHIMLTEAKITRIKEDMFRIGGWQAASRGESFAGDSGRKVLALARADDSLHGPTNARFRDSVETYTGICWRLVKEYGDVPMIVEALGDEAGYLAQPYIDRTRLSPRPPRYRLVSGYGATPEAQGEQLMSLVQTMGADGEPLMSTRAFQGAWPDPSIYAEKNDPQEIRERRPRAINEEIRSLARQIIQTNPQFAQIPLGHPFMQQLAMQINMELDQRFPIMMDDDVEAHLNTLSEITQDESEDALARAIGAVRQMMYYRWIAMQQAQVDQQQVEQQVALQPPPSGGRSTRTPGPNAAEVSGSVTSNALEQASAQEPSMSGA